MKPKKLALNALPFVLTVVILVALLSFIDLHALLAAFRKSDPLYLLAALAISIIFSILLLADKWRRIVNELGYSLSYLDALYIHLASRPISFILPLKSGEFAVAYYLKRQKGFGFMKVASSVLLDKYLALISTLQLCLVGALLLFWGRWALIVVLLAGLLFSLVLVVPLQIPGIRALFSFLSSRFGNATEYLADFTAAFTSIRPARLFFFFGYSHIVQIPQLVIFYLLFLAVDAQAHISVSLFIFAVPAIQLLTNIPITVSGLGTREVFVLYFFRNYAQPEILLAVGILVSLVDYVVPMLVGVVFQLGFIRKLLT